MSRFVPSPVPVHASLTALAESIFSLGASVDFVAIILLSVASRSSSGEANPCMINPIAVA